MSSLAPARKPRQRKPASPPVAGRSAGRGEGIAAWPTFSQHHGNLNGLLLLPDPEEGNQEVIGEKPDTSEGTSKKIYFPRFDITTASPPLSRDIMKTASGDGASFPNMLQSASNFSTQYFGGKTLR